MCHLHVKQLSLFFFLFSDTGRFVEMSVDGITATALGNGDGLCFSAFPLNFRDIRYQFEIEILRIPQQEQRQQRFSRYQHNNHHHNQGFLSVGVTTNAQPSHMFPPSLERMWILTKTHIVHNNSVIASGYATEKGGLSGLCR